MFCGLLRPLGFSWASVAALVVERRPLHASVPVFDLGVLHHVVKCLQALHHSEDAKHRLQTEENGERLTQKTVSETLNGVLGVFPHQVCQVGLISTHELPLLADGHHPVVDGLVEILPDVVLQVVSVVAKRNRILKIRNYKSEPHKQPPETFP